MTGTELTEIELTEAVASLVNHFHHPCAVIVTHPGVKPDIKTLMRKVPVQVVDWLEELEEPGTECGHFVWLGEEEVATLLGRLGEERISCGVWYVMASLPRQLLQHLRLRLDSQLYFLRRSGPTLDLVEVYDVTPGGRRVWNTWGFLHATTLEVEVPHPEMWDRRSDLWGLDLRTVVLPFGDYLRLEDDVLESWFGLVPHIWDSLASRLNFTYTLTRSSDGKWGAQDKVTKPF